MKKLIRITYAVSAVICGFIISLIAYYSLILPDSYTCDSEGKFTLGTFFRISAEPEENLSAAIAAKNAPETSSVTLMLMDIIPVKNAEVRNVERPNVIPCGKPFGIKLIMDGVMVIRTGDVPAADGPVSPAEAAGIQNGDIIKSVSGQQVYSNRDIEKIISETSEKSVSVEFIHDGKTLTTSISPARSAEDGSLRLGLWVRDSSSGIGTITYCDAGTSTFGGLGHPVCDTDTGKIIPLYSGEIMNVNISGVKKGRSGTPGELRGFFTDNTNCGNLCLNNRYGVFGNIEDEFLEGQSIPIALRHEVETGKAEIYSTIEGTEPRKYSIEIKKIDYTDTESVKNMVIKVTDPELIKKTGGIVQGMSGSPIIQNGMVAGAVTHVFVNDPTMGYAVFCENMYEMSHAS